MNVEHDGRRGHGDDPNRRAIGDSPRHLVTDEKPLVEAPIADRGGPRKQEHQRLMRQDPNLGREHKDVDREPVEHRRPNHDEHEKRDQKIEHIGEVPQLSERVPVLDERRRRAQDHDDRRFDDEGERKGDAISREIEGGLVQARDHRGKERSFGRHHQPGGCERHPETKNSFVR